MAVVGSRTKASMRLFRNDSALHDPVILHATEAANREAADHPTTRVVERAGMTMGAPGTEHIPAQTLFYAEVGTWVGTVRAYPVFFRVLAAVDLLEVSRG